jgi:hypothetical protein
MPAMSTLSMITTRAVRARLQTPVPPPSSSNTSIKATVKFWILKAIADLTPSKIINHKVSCTSRSPCVRVTKIWVTTIRARTSWCKIRFQLRTTTKTRSRLIGRPGQISTWIQTRSREASTRITFSRSTIWWSRNNSKPSKRTHIILTRIISGMQTKWMISRTSRALYKTLKI